MPMLSCGLPCDNEVRGWAIMARSYFSRWNCSGRTVTLLNLMRAEITGAIHAMNLTTVRCSAIYYIIICSVPSVRSISIPIIWADCQTEGCKTGICLSSPACTCVASLTMFGLMKADCTALLTPIIEE